MTYARFSVDLGEFRIHELHIGVGHSAFEHFLSFWRDYGVFVTLNQDLVSLRELLPNDLLKKFDAISKHMQHTAKRIEFSTIDIERILTDLASGTFIAFDQVNLSVLGVLEDMYEALTPPVGALSIRLRQTREEVCRIRDLLLTETRRQLDELRATDIAEDIPPERVWNEKLRPLFEVNNLVAVVDQYALPNFVKEHQSINSGLGYLLNRIAAHRGQIGLVEVHTSLRSIRERDGEGAIRKLSDFCKQIGVEKTIIHIADKDTAQRIMHDRFFIGADHTIDVGNGLDLLSASPRRRPITYAFKQMTPHRSHNYHLLRNARRGMRSISF